MAILGKLIVLAYYFLFVVAYSGYAEPFGDLIIVRENHLKGNRGVRAFTQPRTRSRKARCLQSKRLQKNDPLDPSQRQTGRNVSNVAALSAVPQVEASPYPSAVELVYSPASTFGPWRGCNNILVPESQVSATPALWRSLLQPRSRSGASTFPPVPGIHPNIRIDYRLALDIGRRRANGASNDIETVETILRNELINYACFEDDKDADSFLLSDAQVHELALLLVTFASFVMQVSPPTVLEHTRIKLRIVANHGKSATKCPQWHVDHVPFRWIQSLVGPGCQVVMDPKAIRWDNMNALHDKGQYETLTEQQRNRLLVQETEGSIQTIPEGQAVLLIGGTWADWTHKHAHQSGSLDSSRHSSVLPVVHRSPTLLPWQGRVLLTMDVAMNAE